MRPKHQKHTNIPGCYGVATQLGAPPQPASGSPTPHRVIDRFWTESRSAVVPHQDGLFAGGDPSISGALHRHDFEVDNRIPDHRVRSDPLWAISATTTKAVLTRIPRAAMSRSALPRMTREPCGAGDMRVLPVVALPRRAWTAASDVPFGYGASPVIGYRRRGDDTTAHSQLDQVADEANRLDGLIDSPTSRDSTVLCAERLSAVEGGQRRSGSRLRTATGRAMRTTPSLPIEPDLASDGPVEQDRFAIELRLVAQRSRRVEPTTPSSVSGPVSARPRIPRPASDPTNSTPHPAPSANPARDRCPLPPVSTGHLGDALPRTPRCIMTYHADTDRSSDERRRTDDDISDSTTYPRPASDLAASTAPASANRTEPASLAAPSWIMRRRLHANAASTISEPHRQGDLSTTFADNIYTRGVHSRSADEDRRLTASPNPSL